MLFSSNFNLDTRASSRYPELPSNTSSGVGGQLSILSGVSIFWTSRTCFFFVENSPLTGAYKVLTTMREDAEINILLY